MSTALLLNATYAPLRVIPLSRAINLVMSGKAVVEEEGDTVFRSQNLELRAPSVVRLTYVVKIPYKRALPLTRATLAARDNHECQYCGVAVGSKGTIDHVHPRSKGGRHDWTNVLLSCTGCNAKKDDKTLAQLGWTPRSKPFTPRGTAWVIVGLAKSVAPAWEPYLATAS